ncbi:sarcosine oxidase subunit delta [Amycolatopsis sp. CA-230715]|uniref:sarcosine oxidase subunit delta n=1 Tax=Amycolatopsis sp. CA-230715 TaxID=2745196 RepID=UPI001C012194|nr:sarcosine oxidase subunit delta [Amycolatopsis sp. CA-230715]QWF84688.1 Sarcosine oxidase subunit delta [Amycolatopsis sp. CA-230715]
MQLIPCPWCGPREETEFHYGGQAHVAYPADPAALSDEDWAEFVFYRDNPVGPFAERWAHTAGCRRWFNAVRDTVTYEFRSVYEMEGMVNDTGGAPFAMPDRVRVSRKTQREVAS